MTPLKLSVTSYRRLYATTSLVALFIVALFVLNQFSPVSIGKPLQVELLPAIGGALVLLASVVSYVFAKKITHTAMSLSIYAVLLATVALVIANDGTTSSPFLTLWALLGFGAALFGAYGWILHPALSAAALAVLYTSGSFSGDTVIVCLLAGALPVIGGLLVWRQGSSKAADESSRNAKSLANELSEVASKSEIVINAIGDGVIAIDSKGTIELVNPAAQEILGWGKQDAMMLNYKSILKLTDDNNHELDPSQDPLQQVLNTNQQMRANRLAATTQSGKKINISIVVSPIGNAGSGVIAVFRDVTKERAEEREQAEFISTASHEMRTPVASIEGYLGLALNPNTAQVDERAKSYILKAHEAAQHLGHLFQDLLDVSKSEDGRMSSAPKVVDMAEITSTITQGLEQKAKEKGLQLLFKPNENSGQKKIMPVLFVNQDNDHIREILDNLIENAIKYTPEGHVTVDIRGTDNKIVVSVEDSGLGIPPEDIPHLFQKFYRVDNVDRQQIGGTGLGLYLSRRLAESMQGRLWVESTYGKGSTFFLELPRLDTSEAENLKQQQQSKITQQLTPQPATEAPPVLDTTPTPEPAQPEEGRNEAPTQQPSNAAKPATTVPRGESLSREQIAERVRQLEDMARQQREGTPERE